MVEKQTGNYIKILRSDQGGEFKSKEFNQYCKSNGILQQFTVPHTPQQNGVAERKNRTLVECAHSMLQGKNISNVFWDEATNTIVYLKKRSLAKTLELKTPFEAFYGYKPKNAYKLFDPSTHRLLTSRDVVFHENANEGDKINNTSVWHDIDDYVKLDTSDEQKQEQAKERVQVQEQVASSSHDTPKRGEETLQSRKKDENSKTPRRSSRQSQAPVRYKDYALMSLVMNVVEHSSYEEAKEYEEWRDAMNEKYNSIMKNDTWVLTELPKTKFP
eukprot:PITA_17728